MTAKTKSERLRRLISHGYFAPELPPCFVSEDLAKFRKSILAKIDALPAVKGKPAAQRFISEPSWFYFPRYGKDDRRHGVPNPISQLLLARAVSDNYVDLRKKARASGISASPPLFDWSGTRALMRPSIDLRDDFRVELSSRREQYVAADIRAFFHSIYTHAIPWAIYGKTWAKSNRGLGEYGNLIDLLCRNAQDGQTIGLPVGPDTSRLLAEVVASAVDSELRDLLAITERDASRYIDDYTISAPEGQSGESLLAALRSSAAKFELELNNEKSAILPTSVRQNTGWQQTIRAQIPKDFPDSDQIQQYFYRVGRVCAAHPELNIEKFALQNARSALIRATGWRRIQSVLISSYRRNASLISFLVEVFLLRQAQHDDVDMDSLREFIENRIPVLARENRTGEIIWLLFLAIRLKLKISAARIAPLFDVDNGMVSLLTVAAASKGFIDGNLQLHGWNAFLNADGLRGPMWIYAYEGVVQEFIPGADDKFIVNDPYFALLHSKRVRFLSLDSGFTSIGSTLRGRRNENDRLRRLRDALAEDWASDMDEFEEDLEDDDMDDEY